MDCMLNNVTGLMLIFLCVATCCGGVGECPYSWLFLESTTNLQVFGKREVFVCKRDMERV